MKNLLITLAALMLVLGCKKKDNTHYLPDDFKRNFSFKEGSFWIYRDSISGREDSCFVTHNSLSIVNEKTTSSNSFYELLMIRVYQIPKDTTIKDKMEIWFSIIKNELYVSYILSDDVRRLMFKNCPVPMTAQNLATYKQVYPILFIPMIKILGNEYKDLYEIKNNEGLCMINESVGILKMKVTDDLVAYNWELVRHNVIK